MGAAGRPDAPSPDRQARPPADQQGHRRCRASAGGRKYGRPRNYDGKKVALAKRLHAGGDMSAREIADEAGVSASTMYRPLRIETAAVLFSGLTVSP